MTETAISSAPQDAANTPRIFISYAAHELKTPVTTILGNAQLLQRRAARGSLTLDALLPIGQVIVDQTKRLNRMIGMLLDISRIKNGMLTIQNVPLDLSQLVQRVVEEVRPSLDHHALEIQDLPESLTIYGDELRLEQVLQNLLQNAIKYSPDGGQITLRVEPQGSQACITVTDEGIGIPETALPHLFRRFYRIERTDTRQITGMGLGLYVIKEIVDLHKGRVEVESSEGQGSTFRIYLPLAAQPSY